MLLLFLLLLLLLLLLRIVDVVAADAAAAAATCVVHASSSSYEQVLHHLYRSRSENAARGYRISDPNKNQPLEERAATDSVIVTAAKNNLAFVDIQSGRATGVVLSPAVIPFTNDLKSVSIDSEWRFLGPFLHFTLTSDSMADVGNVCLAYCNRCPILVVINARAGWRCDREVRLHRGGSSLDPRNPGHGGSRGARKGEPKFFFSIL